MNYRRIQFVGSKNLKNKTMQMTRINKPIKIGTHSKPNGIGPVI